MPNNLAKKLRNIGKSHPQNTINHLFDTYTLRSFSFPGVSGFNQAAAPVEVATVYRSYPLLFP